MRLIVNGKAAANPQLRSAVKQLREKGHALEVRVTWEAGDADRFVQEALQDKVDVVIAAGGDGTINEIVTGLMKSETGVSMAVGIVPFGTANDFAKCCGIPIGDPLAALELIASSDPVLIDVACCNDRYFINVASGGFGAEVTSNTPPEMKQVLGGAAYSLIGLVTALKMEPYSVCLTTPDGKTQEGQLFVVAVGNGRLAGGGYQIAPDAILNDGLLDVLGIINVGMSELGSVFSELANVTASGNKYVHYQQLSAFSIESNKPMQMNLDGEPIRDTTFKFHVLSNALRFILPPGAPLNQ